MAAVALECWSSKPRSSEEDTFLMNKSDCDSATTTTTTTTGMQKRFQKMSRNARDAINSLLPKKNIIDPPSSPRKVVWSSVVRNLTQLYPGSQLPDKLVSNIRNHYDSFPLSYAQAGFDMKDVFLHIRLLEQSCLEDQPCVFIQHLSDDPIVYNVTFASNSTLSWPSISSAFDSFSITCNNYQIFDKKGSTLGILHIPIPVPPTDVITFKLRIQNALRSASKKPKSTNRKLSFGLCGCQEDTWRRTDLPDFDEDLSYRNSVDHSHPPNFQLDKPLPSSSLLVSVDEWQTVRGAVPEVHTWLLNCDSLEFTDQIGPSSFKGFYKAKRVSIDKLKGCDKGNAYDFEIRKDLLQLMTCGHRNVLPFYGVCIDDIHGLCVVTRFMEGGSVQDFMLKHKKILTKDVVRIAIDIAQGLKFMNDHGVAYQDLNTQRIFLDRHGNASLGDMGIVTACKRSGDAVEYETDGYRWLAPEIIAADPESASETWMSNVYSYGMVVWEMINGEAAYSGYSPVQAAVGIAACDLRPEIPKDCPQVLKSVMVKCWNKCPQKRPELSEILSLLLGD